MLKGRLNVSQGVVCAEAIAGVKRSDPQRIYGALERELIYYRDKKRCAVCGCDVAWPDLEIHHVEEHGKGGMTTLENGVLVHKDCHPKGAKAVEFAKKWAAGKVEGLSPNPSPSIDENSIDEDDDEEMEQSAIAK